MGGGQGEGETLAVSSFKKKKVTCQRDKSREPRRGFQGEQDE